MNSKVHPKIACIHVGIHKTASTWMQLHGFALHPNVKLVNFAGSPFEKFWYQKFVECGDFEYDGTSVRERLDLELKSAGYSSSDVLVISEENISGHIYTGANARRNADRLIDLVGGTCKVFMMIRRQPEYLASAYSNFINHGGALSFRGWLEDENLPTKLIFDKLKYDTLISYYQGLFGSENVLVLPYEMMALDRGVSVMNRFFKFVGVDPLDMAQFDAVRSKKPNAGFSPLGVRLARLVNGVRGRMTRNQRRALLATDRFLLRYLSGKSRYFSQGEANSWAEYYRASNKRTSALIKIDLQGYGYSV